MPEKQLFDQYIAGPATQLSAAIKKDGNRTFYEKQWRNYIETQVVHPEHGMFVHRVLQYVLGIRVACPTT